MAADTRFTDVAIYLTNSFCFSFGLLDSIMNADILVM